MHHKLNWFYGYGTVVEVTDNDKYPYRVRWDGDRRGRELGYEGPRLYVPEDTLVRPLLHRRIAMWIWCKWKGW